MYGNANASFTVHFDSPADCDGLMMASCAQPGANSADNMAYFASCAEALQSAPCVPASAEHFGYLLWPEGCERDDDDAP